MPAPWSTNLSAVRLADRISAVFLEHGRLEGDRHGVLFETAEGSVAIPAALAAVVFLEPGTVVTHAAMARCAHAGTLIVWVGEGGAPIYSAGRSITASSEALLQQTSVVVDPVRRIASGRRLLERMTGQQTPPFGPSIRFGALRALGARTLSSHRRTHRPFLGLPRACGD